MHRVYTNGHSRIDAVVACIIYPFLKISSSCTTQLNNIKNGITGLFLYKNRVALLERENDALRNQLVELQAYAIIKEESQRLFDFNKRYATENHLPVKVLGYRQTLKGEQFLLLDAGSWQGIKQHAVVVYESFLVGKVTHVYPWYCRVMLITDKQCQVAAVCTKTKIKGIYAGIGNDTQGRLLHVERIEKPRLGDTVLSSGEGAIFPYGFGIGTIEYLQEDGLYHAINVRSFVDFSSLSYCSILRS